MNDWQDEIEKAVLTTIKDFEQLSKNFSEWVEIVAEEVTEEVVETLDFLTEQIDVYLPREIDDFLRDIFQPLLDLEENWGSQDWDNEDGDNSFTEDFPCNPKIEASLEFHPACIGCANYHGRVYSGNILICGMHPYGWETENCPDWQKKPDY